MELILDMLSGETSMYSLKLRGLARAYQEKAEERYRLRELVRNDIRKKISEMGPLGADTPERVSLRKAMLKKSYPLDGNRLERVIGGTDLLGINYLDMGLKASQSVCRIQVRDESGCVLGFGTGFLVSPVLLITNNHVLSSIELCRRSLADFNFEDDINFIPEDTKSFSFEPDRFFYTNEELDFTLVAVRPQATDGSSLSSFGFLRLIGEQGKMLLGEYVTIIQHPDGGPKQITLRENQCVDLPDSFMHYLTDTKPGSSGSPAFNDQWQVVALHHSGVQKRDSQGRVLSTDGKVWDPSMGEDKIAWAANEGVRISSICQDLLSKMGSWTSEQQKLADGVLSTTGQITSGLTPHIDAKEQAIEWYQDSTGYDPNFLGQNVPLPKISEAAEQDVAPLKQGSGYELKYTHFSVVMSKSRKIAFFTAVNIDGDRLVKIPRSGDRWYFDSRIDREYQSGPELYELNELDRGHLVRRLDPTWGDEDTANEANEDTFHFTNSSPQHKKLNQQTWQNLEDYILKNASRYGLKVVVFTGPVLRDDDMLYRGKFQIPAEYWKVVAIVKEDGRLSATAYLQTQKNLIVNLEWAYGEYKTYQVPVAKIEALTRLDFGDLRNQDPLAGIEGTLGRVVTRPDDIRL